MQETATRLHGFRTQPAPGTGAESSGILLSQTSNFLRVLCG